VQQLFAWLARFDRVDQFESAYEKVCICQKASLNFAGGFAISAPSLKGIGRN
jgi:hypothetical protein